MFWTINKCKVCGVKIKGESAFIRLKTAEGEHEIETCDQCGDFFEKSYEVLRKGKKGKKGEAS